MILYEALKLEWHVIFHNINGFWIVNFTLRSADEIADEDLGVAKPRRSTKE